MHEVATIHIYIDGGWVVDFMGNRHGLPHGYPFDRGSPASLLKTKEEAEVVCRAINTEYHNGKRHKTLEIKRALEIQ
jgi:hypothetical protein